MLIAAQAFSFNIASISGAGRGHAWARWEGRAEAAQLLAPQLIRSPQGGLSAAAQLVVRTKRQVCEVVRDDLPDDVLTRSCFNQSLAGLGAGKVPQQVNAIGRKCVVILIGG
ncbi:MAG: hypothetical protein ACRDSR_13950 [Pseudonocardiaceae bacterium]